MVVAHSDLISDPRDRILSLEGNEEAEEDEHGVASLKVEEAQQPSPRAGLI